MKKEIAIQTLLSVGDYFNKNAAAYTTWGEVSLLQAAVRIDKDSYLYSDGNFNFNNFSTENYKIGYFTESSAFAAIFTKRKKIQLILKTRQLYASKINVEIPPILDDQAQLLGVSVKIAPEQNIAKALNHRFAAISDAGDCFCIGRTVEDAFVAAQLLEKTAKVFLEAKALGGAKPINRLEAWFMQQYFLLKYAKEASKNIG